MYATTKAASLGQSIAAGAGLKSDQLVEAKRVITLAIR